MTPTARSAVLAPGSRPPQISRAWILDGAGPARFGWCYRHACRIEWLGRTWADVVARAVEATP